MKGYLTKTRRGYTLTIVDNSRCKHHFNVNNLNKFVKKHLGTPLEEIQCTRGLGQRITNRIGFGYDVELESMNRYSLIAS
jgi:hypothetical protein